VTTRTAADRRTSKAKTAAKVAAPKAVPASTPATKRSRSAIARAVDPKNATVAGRRLVKSALAVLVILVGIMMAVVVAQTRIAENQMQLDRIESRIESERDRYNQLRLERSLLREPARLVVEARSLGMQPGIGVDFTTVDPMTVAAVLVATGGVDPELLTNGADPLQEYGEFKAIVGGAP
jgi:cell division protein FtsL